MKMPKYDINNLGEKEFEHLIQTLIKEIIGFGTITFGEGPDGGREATFSGKAGYPSKEEQWDGEWIFQAKFHDIDRIGPENARKQIITDLEKELEKISDKYKHKCDNYILATNVPLSSIHELGTHDKISKEIIPRFKNKILNIHVWGYDEICRFLELFPKVRIAYLQFITPGDLIAQLIGSRSCKDYLAETILLYVRTSYDREIYAKLNQAGEVAEKQTQLQKVFVDLNLGPRSEKDLALFRELNHDFEDTLHVFDDEEAVSATHLLLTSNLPKVVLIGGPGQGKSTLSQFIAQIHRAYLLHKIDSLDPMGQNFSPIFIRIPFRVSLKDYAQWIVDSEGSHTLESYLANFVTEGASRSISSEQIQYIFRDNPCLVIFDGLDEVSDNDLRREILNEIHQFLGRSNDVLNSDIQLIATSRPTGYLDQFDPSDFLHTVIAPMDQGKVLEYTDRWIQAKGLDTAKGKSLRSSMNDCLNDSVFSLLMNTPLQVTIFILIILNGGIPPRQREGLFQEYLEIIYKRERAKSKMIIQTDKELLFGLHGYIGYLLHKRAAKSMDTQSKMRVDEFFKEVLNYLRVKDPYSDIDKLKDIAKQFTREAHERLVLLVELDTGLFGFELRPIQEFFAAAYLVDETKDYDQKSKRFQAIALSPHWRNVALFFAGRIGRVNPGEAALILEVCRDIDRDKPDCFVRRGAWLSLEIALDRSFGPKRMLQRGAIEYALTILNGDLDFEKRYKFISEISQLPKDDIHHHVMPLLIERLKKFNLFEGFSTLDIYKNLSGDLSSIEATLTLALERKDSPKEIILAKSLEYRLSPEYIKSKFSKILYELDEYTKIDLLYSNLFNNSEYLSKIWSEPDESINHACRVLLYNIFKIFPISPRLTKIGEFSINANVISQINLAWKIYSFYRFGIYRYRNQDIDKNYIYSRFSTEAFTNIIAALDDPSVIFELKATIISLLAGIHFFHDTQDKIKILLQKYPASFSEYELDVIERISFYLSVPSLEKTNLQMKKIGSYDLNPQDIKIFVRDAFEEQKMLRFSEARDRWISKISQQDLIHLYILDSLSMKQVDEVPKELFWLKSFPNELYPFIIRGEIKYLAIEFKAKLQLDIEFIISVLGGISDVLDQSDYKEWRSWNALFRLSIFEWSNANPYLAKSLNSLFSVLEIKKELSEGYLALSALLVRCAEITGLEDFVLRILYLFNRASDNQRIIERIPTILKSNMTQAIGRIIETAFASNDIALCGFLKWFSLFYASLPKDNNNIDLSGISFDNERIKHLIGGHEGRIREGALLLLAMNGSMTYNDCNQLLRSSKIGYDQFDDAWGELVKRAIKDPQSKDAIDFYENILSESTKYPKAVIFFVQKEYEQSATERINDIGDLEEELGLPFQDII
jgi:hypothetical protein